MAKNTKVILRDSVNGLGQSGDVVEVAAGYARNFLLPQGLAFAWSKGAEAQIEQMQRARRALALASREDAVAAKATIEGSTVEISAKVSESGKLFGAIAAPEVAKALSAQGTAVAAKAVTVENIKTTGEFAATVQLHPEISAQFTVKVVAE
ncbi:50S ribosomal protein L9 [Alloscardovia macacae]|uniref:Large ribosomal subunit protein bL9 n=1 Tax=Alloscardovia macacae TaxID=1160091 RepID=A0A1Y2SVU9_9BIFI|nr:50S ribosomal protein L9 [Alloscardovia macacae]OTA25672.1 50S ribosomal protein L9 [Alloscardovia macacae]OTA29613.1 50S ribosomal protein L9 [Alloscardovia macacae]OZG54917.1 50S ribosomal protein L9 [Alloscardovia macacae]